MTLLTAMNANQQVTKTIFFVESRNASYNRKPEFVLRLKCVCHNKRCVRARAIECGVTSDYKGSEIRDTSFSRFLPCVINLSRNKNICFVLKKVVAKSRARDYFEDPWADKATSCALCFIQFVVYSMRNPVVYRTAKKIVLCWLLELLLKP